MPKQINKLFIYLLFEKQMLLIRMKKMKQVAKRRVENCWHYSTKLSIGSLEAVRPVYAAIHMYI